MNYLLSVAGLIIVGLGFGWYQADLRKDNAIMAKDHAEQQFTVINDHLVKIGKDLDMVEGMMVKYQATKQEVQSVTKEVTKQVIEYRDRVPERCQLNSMWVTTYNLSTQRTTEGAARVNDSTPGNGATVDDALALRVSTDNNRVCIEEKERLRALQEWVRGITGGNIPPSG